MTEPAMPNPDQPAQSQPQRGGVFGPWRRFRRDRRGVAAVEFALLVPIMLALYLGTMEISNGVSLNQRVARAASTVGDLVAQQDTVNRAQLHAIMDVGESVLLPYNSDNPRITITAIDVDLDYPQGGKVEWSRRLRKDGSYRRGFANNADITVPDRLKVDESFLLRVEVEVRYLPLISWVTDRDGTNGIALSETFWLQPRLADRIVCTNC